MVVYNGDLYICTKAHTSSTFASDLAANDWNKAVYNTDVTYGYPSNDILKIQILANGDYKINYNPGPKA